MIRVLAAAIIITAIIWTLVFMATKPASPEPKPPVTGTTSPPCDWVYLHDPYPTNPDIICWL